MDESQSAVSHHLRGLEKAGCFPFWHMLVYSRKNFIDYSKKCPGLKMLKRRYYTKEEILEWANNEYEMEKKYFLEMKKHNFNILIVYSFLSKDMIA